MKKAMQVIIPILAAVVAIFGYIQLTGVEGLGFIYTVRYDGDMDALRTVLDAFPDGTAVRIVFGEDRVVIRHSDKMQLMGQSDSSWNIGDWLPLHKTDGVWREMTRYLKP